MERKCHRDNLHITFQATYIMRIITTEISCVVWYWSFDFASSPLILNTSQANHETSFRCYSATDAAFPSSRATGKSWVDSIQNHNFDRPRSPSKCTTVIRPRLRLNMSQEICAKQHEDWASKRSHSSIDPGVVHGIRCSGLQPWNERQQKPTELVQVRIVTAVTAKMKLWGDNNDACPDEKLSVHLTTTWSNVLWGVRVAG